MFVKEVINIGEKIEVVVEGGFTSKEKVCFSMVQDVPQQDEMWITLPTVKGEPVVLSIGQRVSINFFRQHGQFYFDAEIVARKRTETLHLLLIKQTSPINRLQRRNFFRLKISLPVSLHVSKQDLSQEKAYHVKAYTVDLSGGGVRLLTDEKLEPGQQLKCTIPIGEKEFLELNGKVVRILPCIDGNYKFEAGIMFVDILESERDRLIKFIFQQQRRLKSKGLI